MNACTIVEPLDYVPEPEYHLVKTDKNGTRTYQSEVCPKCHGNGYLPEYHYVDGGVCFCCNGTGRKTHTLVIRTPEYDEKLRLRRLARVRKNADSDNAEMFAKLGLSPDGCAYAVMGDTYAIRKNLKAEGARFDRVIGWYFDHQPENYETVLIPCDAQFYLNEYTYHYEGLPCSEIVENVRKIKDGYYAKHTSGEAFGEVGGKYELALTLTHVGGYSTDYGWTNVYTFTDSENHTFVWRTSVEIDTEWKIFKVRGTVKEHKQYKGVNQTVLTRCKVA